MDITINAIAPEGFPITLHLQDDDSKALIQRATSALSWLKEKGFTAPPVANSTASGNSSNGQPESKVCPIHHAPMRMRSGKGGDTWYSHRAVNPETGQEYWCKGKGQ